MLAAEEVAWRTCPRQRGYFRPALQALVAVFRESPIAERARDLSGVEVVAATGRVRWPP
jgi:hypothetical protein